MSGKRGGGAWKVAYADFITAMMALFMVLWILGSEQETLEQLQEYFRNPPNPFADRSSGIIFEDGSFRPSIAEEYSPQNYFDRMDPEAIANLVRDFYRMLELSPEDEDRPVDVQVTSDGIQLVLFDRSEQPFFRPGTDELTEWGQLIVQNLSWIIARYTFQINISGHTAPESDYDSEAEDAWLLSLQRAAKVRGRLAFYAVGEDQFHRVAGYADTRPLPDFDLESESHRRVTIGLKITDTTFSSTITLEEIPD